MAIGHNGPWSFLRYGSQINVFRLLRSAPWMVPLAATMMAVWTRRLYQTHLTVTNVTFCSNESHEGTAIMEGFFHVSDPVMYARRWRNEKVIEWGRGSVCNFYHSRGYVRYTVYDETDGSIQSHLGPDDVRPIEGFNYALYHEWMITV